MSENFDPSKMMSEHRRSVGRYMLGFLAIVVGVSMAYYLVFPYDIAGFALIALTVFLVIRSYARQFPPWGKKG